MKTINECTVGELMSKPVVMIKETAPISEAVAKMSTSKVSALVVEKAHDHDVFGILTRKDIVLEATDSAEDMSTLTVHELATKPAIDIQASVSVKHAVRLMRLVGIRRLLVLEGDKPVGLLSNTDIFRRVAQEIAGAAAPSRRG
jgi:CBS domain-containing protein